MLHDAYLNIHVHNSVFDERILAVENICIALNVPIVPKQPPYSIGLHPWHIAAFLERYSIAEICEYLSSIIAQHMTNDTKVLIGEIGIDKAIELPVSIQTVIFTEQLQLAKQYSRPVIIHCVRAYGEIQSAIKQSGFRGTVVFHGFRGSAILAKQLSEKGYFISLGWKLWQERGDLFMEILKSVDKTRILFETDMFDSEKVIDLHEMAGSVMGFDYRANRFAVFGVDKMQE